MRQPVAGDPIGLRVEGRPWTPVWFVRTVGRQSYYKTVMPKRPGGDLLQIALWDAAHGTHWRFVDEPGVFFTQPCPGCSIRMTHAEKAKAILTEGHVKQPGPKGSKDCEWCLGSQRYPWEPFAHQPVSRIIDEIIGWR